MLPATSLVSASGGMRLERKVCLLLETRERSPDIREKLDGRVLVGNGAVGTSLVDRFLEHSDDAADHTYPELSPRSLEERVREINIAPLAKT